MATIVATRPPPAQMSRADPAKPAQLTINTSQRGTPAAIPHKHLPYCSPGPRPQLVNPSPLSPSISNNTATSQVEATTSTTYPPDNYPQLPSSSPYDPPIYGISASQLSQALEHLSTQPLPSARQVFPWLHGLHAENHLQLAFFIARKRSLRRTPTCLRGLTIVKTGGDLSRSKLKSAIAPEELLLPQQDLSPRSPTPSSRSSTGKGHSKKKSAGNNNTNTNSSVSQEEEDEQGWCDSSNDGFIDIDPRDGFSVRNFQIQACKMATVSDLVVYGDAHTPRKEVEALARRLARAQTAWQLRKGAEYTKSGFVSPVTAMEQGERLFNTFVLTDDYEFIETDHPDLVALDSEGCMSPKVMDFFHRERLEMYSMSAPTEISHNVWLGPTPDPSLNRSYLGEGLDDEQEEREQAQMDYDLMIEANDLAQVPDPKAFKLLESLFDRKETLEMAGGTAIPQLEFPGSGAILPPTWSQSEVDGLMATCEWLYNQAHHSGTTSTASSAKIDLRTIRRDSKLSLSPTQSNSSARDAEGDTPMPDAGPADSPSSNPTTGRKILIHCNDGYTESSLLALAYYMYAEAAPVHEAWLALHRERGRNFFAYGSDVALLRAIQPRILQASPKTKEKLGSSPETVGGLDSATATAAAAATCYEADDDEEDDSLKSLLCPPAPEWLDKMDGSLPSRILEYMYLGNLGHANNPGLLKELGIGQILSVGEPVSWSPEVRETWPAENLLFVDQVQDNGVDPLLGEFGRCLGFIEAGREKGMATLVHCRVGVSRSATICIAEVMNELGLSFPRAYCFVRARRLNVIIQPHLRFCYELLKWEEFQCQKRGVPLRRELEWATIAHEIAAMNRPYSKQ